MEAWAKTFTMETIQMSGHSWGWLCGVVMNPKAVHSVQLACFLCRIFAKRKYSLSQCNALPCNTMHH